MTEKPRPVLVKANPAITLLFFLSGLPVTIKIYSYSSNIEQLAGYHFNLFNSLLVINKIAMWMDR
jgi:hypothetical protein